MFYFYVALFLIWVLNLIVYQNRLKRLQNIVLEKYPDISSEVPGLNNMRFQHLVSFIDELSFFIIGGKKDINDIEFIKIKSKARFNFIVSILIMIIFLAQLNTR